ncbi:MAG: helix-turn-helix domain-containing protein [Bdellovibrionales bacterium]
MYKDIKAILKRIGLKDQEARVYLTCLRYKDGLFIYEIAKEISVGRTTVDLMVKRLVHQGVLNRVKVGRRFRFFALAPEALLFRQKQLVEDLEQVVPMLSILGGQRKDMEILYFEGTQGIRQVHDDILLNVKFAQGEKRNLLCFSSSPDFMRVFPDAQKVFIDKRIKCGAWFKAIATRESVGVPIASNDPKALRAMKYMPKGTNPFRMEMYAYADSVMIYSTVKPIGGVIIRNEKIADSLRALFTLVWSLLPENND